MGETKKAGGHKIKRNRNKQQTRKERKTYIGQFNKFKSIWEDKEEKEKRQQEKGGKRDD